MAPSHSSGSERARWAKIIAGSWPAFRARIASSESENVGTLSALIQELAAKAA